MRSNLSVICITCSLLVATASFAEGEADDTASESGRAVNAGAPVGSGGAGVSTMGHHHQGSHGTRKNQGHHNVHSNHHQNHGHQVHVTHNNGPAIVQSATPHPSVNTQAHSQASSQQSFVVVNPGGHVLTGQGATHGNAWWKHPQPVTSGVATSPGSGLTPATQSPQAPTGAVTSSYPVPTLQPNMVPTPTPYQVPTPKPYMVPHMEPKLTPAQQQTHTGTATSSYPVPTLQPGMVPTPTPYQVPSPKPYMVPHMVPKLTTAQKQKIKQMGVNFQKQIIVVGQGSVPTNVPHQLILTPQQIILVPQYNSYYHHPNYNPYVSVYHNFDGRTYLYNNAIPFNDTNFHLIVAGVREPTPKELLRYHPVCESKCDKRLTKKHRVYK